MKQPSRFLLVGALILVLLTAACGSEQGAGPTLVGTLLPDGNNLTGTPFGGIATAETVQSTETTTGLETPTTGLETATLTTGLETPTPLASGGIATQAVGTVATGVGTTRTAVVPVTGEDVILVECQFCVDTRAHALLVLPDTASFSITSPAASTNAAADTQPACTTVEVNNGRQVVLCSGPEMTPLVVNICTGGGNCKDFPVDLLACPLTQGGAVNPGQTQPAPGTSNNNSGANATATTGPGGVTISTATPAGALTPTVTSTP